MKLSAAIKTPDERKFMVDTAWNVVSMAVVALAGLLLNAAIFKFRGAGDLAVFNLAYTVYLVASQLAVGGVHASVLSYASRHTANPGRCRRILRSALALALTCSLAAAALLALLLPLIGRGYGKTVEAAVLAVLPGLVLFSINKVLQMFFNAMRYMKWLAATQALRALAILGWVAGVLIGGASSARLPWALSAAELPVLLLSAAALCRPAVCARSSREIAGILGWMRRHWSFGWRGGLSGVLIGANTHLDILFLGVFYQSSPQLVGIYSFCAMYAEGFGQLIMVIRRQLDPLWGRYFAVQNVAAMEALAVKVKRIFYAFIIAAGAITAIIFPFWMRLLRPESDWITGGWLFAILIFGYCAVAPYRSFMGIVLQGNRPGSYTLIIAAGLLCNAVLNLLLLQLIGVYGAAAATAAAFIIQSALLVWFCRKAFGVRL